jgi:hypothetical protein
VPINEKCYDLLSTACICNRGIQYIFRDAHTLLVKKKFHHSLTMLNISCCCLEDVFGDLWFVLFKDQL